MARKIQIQFTIRALLLIGIVVIFNSSQASLSGQQVLVKFSIEDSEPKGTDNLELLIRLAEVYAKMGDLENEKKIRTKLNDL